MALRRERHSRGRSGVGIEPADGLRHVIVRSDESVTENQKLSYAMYTLMPRRERTQPNIAVAKNVGAIIAAPPASETMPHTRVPSARAPLGPPA